MEIRSIRHGQGVDPIFAPSSIRRAANAVFCAAEGGALQHFHLQKSKLDQLGADLARQIDPISVQPHTQWRNFEQDGVPRIAALNQQLTAIPVSPLERTQSRLDLLFLNEALETGGNGTWRYYDALSDKTLSRTEALAVATLRLFQNGFFSSDPSNPLQVTSTRLRAITETELAESLQVSRDNPILGGIEAKHERLQLFAKYLDSHSEFQDRSGARPGNVLRTFPPHTTMHIEPLFSFLAQSLTAIWPGNTRDGTPLGDAWHLSALSDDPILKGVAPIHRIAQWLHYAIAPALNDFGLSSFSTTELTGLPGYRNTGLLVDSRIITPKDSTLFSREHSLGDEPIVELRCLTIGAMDHVLRLIHHHRNIGHAEFPMAKLNGLFWHAGRAKAAELRQGGSPPFAVRDEGVPF